MASKNYLKCTIRPKDREALERAIKREIKRAGPLCSLNHIDVSNVTNLYALFKDSAFNGDISKWNVSNATHMWGMFEGSQFNGDISQWNVSNVKDMNYMFEDSVFNSNISDWNVSNVLGMTHMFANSPFDGDLSKWNVANVSDFRLIFHGTAFQGDISAWPINRDATIALMFDPQTLLVMDTPSIFHWRCAEMGILPVSPKLQAYYAKYAPLINNLTSDPVERSYCMHALWRQQVAPNASPEELYPIDGAVFEETP